MEGDSTHENSSRIKHSSWTLGDVMMSDSASHFGVGRDDDDVGNFIHSLGDQGEGLLNEETVNKITEILTPEQRMLLEEEVAGSLIKNASERPGLSLETAQPCCQVTEHAQARASAMHRPSHGGQVDAEHSRILNDISLENREIMQQEDGSIDPEAFMNSGTIKEGLQKIKQQLSKGGKLVAPEADPGPAVVTEFIGDHGSIGFGAELDDVSKCILDSHEQSVEKFKETDPPVRRSGRKTVRLFEIVPPKKYRKKEGENEDQHTGVRSGTPENGKDGASKWRSHKQGGTEKAETSPPRKSQRKQKEEKLDVKKEDKHEKKTGKGSKQTSDNEENKKSESLKTAKTKTTQSETEKKPRGRKPLDKAKKEADGKTGSNEEKQQKKPRGRVPKNKAGAGAKTESKKEVKGRRGRKKNEESGKDGSISSDSELSDSEPDDGELSDDGSEFDPDDDPDRPWCICRKPHGNRFMICCDICEDWFHGDCVGVTQADGKELEKKGEEWMCPKCKKKLNVLAKEVKEKERQERLKMRQKTEVSSDENSTVEMRKKLLKALEKELVSDKAAKKFDKEDLTESEEEDEEVDEGLEETKLEGDAIVFDEFMEKTTKKVKKKMTKEEREAKEAKQREKELEWKRQLKEMKERAQKAQQIAKRKDSIESQMTFDKISPQKMVKPKEEHSSVKQEPSEKKAENVKREIKVRFADNLPERRKSDTSAKNIDRKRPIDAGRRASSDGPKEKIVKSEDPGKKVRITPTPKTVKPAQPPKFCIVCNKVAMKNAVYCSKDCMTSYTKESLRLLEEDKLRRLGLKSPEVKSPVSKDPAKGTTLAPSPTDGDKNERITVVERSTKKIIAGVMAPTKANIYQWIEEHPTFEVFRPTSSKSEGVKASSFYGNRAKEKIQIPAATTTSTSAKEKKDLTEVVRSNVKKSLKETILTRCRDVGMEVDADEVSKTCNSIEEEIVKMFGDTGQKYKTKYRSLIFNLKDSKNRSLFKQVVQGELTPTKLVHMTPEQLASAELAKWREREAKHNLELIKMREEEEAYALKHALKKTHKGEVEVEQDGKEDMKNLQIHIENAEEHKEQQSEDGVVPLPFEDTTEQHSSHLFDLNCKICTGKQQPEGEKQPILPHVSTSVIQAISESSMQSPTASPDEMDLRQNSPDVIESLDRSPIHIPLPSKERDDPVWRGNVMMPSVAKFSANAYRISGPCDHLSKLVPDTAHIYGRITHEQVWDYLYQLKSTTHKTIEVLRFEMAAEDEKKDYVALYTYFYTRKRIGVIGNCYSGVKDMYIVPIASHDPIPPELKPFDGPGMPDPRPHMLIGIIVRTKPIVPSKRPKTSHHETPEHSHKKKKHKHKKEEKKKYEDIVFGGKQRPGIALEDTPSESGGSYTPSYTPDVMSPPSQVSVPSAGASLADENFLLEEKLAEQKLAEQKKELMKLKAEIRAQISENKALGIEPTPETLLETSTIGSPSSMQPLDSQTPLSSIPGLNASVSSSASSTFSTTASEYSASSSAGLSSVGVHGSFSITSDQDRSKHVSGYAGHDKLVVNTTASQYKVETIPLLSDPSPVSTVATATPVSAGLSSQFTAAQHQSDLDVNIPGLGDIGMIPTTTQSVVTEDNKVVAEEDEPYDPEDELDISMEADAKVNSKEFTKKDIPGDKAKAASGDEPYDPEDDFVLDLIEDISVPTPLKKIEKPNLPFPLEMPKKPESKMPELPPIKLPDKFTDRRAAGMITGNTPVDPRSSTSPMGHGTWTLTPTGTPSTQSPSARNLTSPTGSGSQLTSPTVQRATDTRPSVQIGFEKPDSVYQQDHNKPDIAAYERPQNAGHDGTQSAPDYWQSNRGQEQSYAAYNQYQTSGRQMSGGTYDNAYGDNYHQHWQSGQRPPDSSWQGYDYNTHQEDNRAWESDDRGFNAPWRGDYYGNQAYDNYDNSSYQRTHEYSNYDSYSRRDDRGRPWDGYGGRGYYRNRDRGRSRGKKWR